jgi:HD-like signal output (HDOD) protein
MTDDPARGVNGWACYLDQTEIPVLRATVEQLERLREQEDSLNGRVLSDAILHDPLMTVKVLRYLQQHRSRSQTTDITTIGRAIMMLGMTRFFEQFTRQPLIEDRLAGHPEALEGMMEVISRAHHAALYAQDWSALRVDIDSDEVTVAALLHDVAEILLWCFAPGSMLEIRRRMRHDPELRSAAAQRQVLGFEVLELQQALASAWHLPALLQSLMDDRHADAPRPQRVMLAVNLARHSAGGWFDAALPDDYAAIARHLRLPENETWERIRQVTLAAAKDWEWYGVSPAAARLPMLPGPWPE